MTIVHRCLISLVLAASLSLALPATPGPCQEGSAEKAQTPQPQAASITGDGDATYPIKVSENGRYFVDQRGKPVFWLGTTQWELFRGYSLADARTIFEKSKSKGFAFVQVMLMGVGDGTVANIEGEKPWIDNNPLTPNEAYFKHVDEVLDVARESGLVVSMTIFHQKHRERITAGNARAWAKWVGNRYKSYPGIVWSMTPVAEPASIPVLRELVAGLREGDGGTHLITAKPDPAPYSSSFVHDEGLLDFNSIQTWADVELIYPMVTKDYALAPQTPVLMAEGAYEHGSEYGFDVSPLWVRRQAYYSYLAGGHHTYGHNDSWRVLPTWKEALDAPGATQLGVLKRIFLGVAEWWDLVPDQSVLAAGGKTDGNVLNLAARHKDGKWILVYWGGRDTSSIYKRLRAFFAGRSSISIHMERLAAGGQSDALWIDPRTGKTVPAGHFSNIGVQAIAVPDEWEDAVLVLRAAVD